MRLLKEVNMKFLFVIIGILLASNYVSSQACYIAFLQIIEDDSELVETDAVIDLNIDPGTTQPTNLGVELTCEDGKVKACIGTSCETVGTDCDTLYVIGEDNKKTISCKPHTREEDETLPDLD